MKILVLSDSHGHLQYMVQALQLEQPDVILHLGDCERDAQLLQQDYAPFAAMCCVSGNCDYAPHYNQTHIATYEGYRFFMTHGHRYHVKTDLLRLQMAAREQMADVALFGHTHMAYCSGAGGMWMLNPGSCSGVGRISYGIVTIEEGTLQCQVRYLTK